MITTALMIEIDDNERVILSEEALANISTTTILIGGDDVASTNFTIPQTDFNVWLEERLGRILTHYEDGDMVWQGRISNITIEYKGSVITVSTDDIINKVTLKYKSSSSGNTVFSAPAENSASIARYGERWVHFATSVALDSTEANAIAKTVVAQSAYDNGGDNQLPVKGSTGYRVTLRAQGHYHDLKHTYQFNVSTTAVDSSVAIEQALTDTDIVLSSISTGRSVKSDYDATMVWSRITDLISLGTSTDARLAALIVGGKTLRVFPLETEVVDWEAEQIDGEMVYFATGSANPVTPSQIQVGDIVFRRDLFGDAAPANPLISDPRATLVVRKRVSRGRVTLEGSNNRQNKFSVLSQLAQRS